MSTNLDESGDSEIAKIKQMNKCNIDVLHQLNNFTKLLDNIETHINEKVLHQFIELTNFNILNSIKNIVSGSMYDKNFEVKVFTPPGTESLSCTTIGILSINAAIHTGRLSRAPFENTASG